VRFEQQILRRVANATRTLDPPWPPSTWPKREGLAVSRETLRKWMVKASLWRPRAQRIKTIHVWRERLDGLVRQSSREKS
jgi:hypothetical protein